MSSLHTRQLGYSRKRHLLLQSREGRRNPYISLVFLCTVFLCSESPHNIFASLYSVPCAVGSSLHMGLLRQRITRQGRGRVHANSSAGCDLTRQTRTFNATLTTLHCTALHFIEWWYIGLKGVAGAIYPRVRSTLLLSFHI